MSVKRVLTVIAVPLSALLLLPGQAGAHPDPFQLYGPSIEFDVFRAGDKVGRHTVRFTRSGNELKVESAMNLAIEVLFITVFRYAYRAEGTWRNRQLQNLVSRVDDNGRKYTVAAARQGEFFNLTRPDDISDAAAAPVIPTNHWNPEVLNQTRVLNTLTGRINAVRIEPRGPEQVDTERGPVPAMRYAYTGALQNEVWYDSAGRWVKLRFQGRDGSTIEYVCRLCQGTPPAGQTE